MRYPNKIRKENLNSIINYKNRGMSLENALNITNKYYLDNDIAVIYKKPTPIKVLNTMYKTGKKQMITEAYYQEKSTTDYNGIYKGKYIDFEAKETTNKLSFPLSNIHIHQIKHIKRVLDHGGIAFIIVMFASINKIYLMPGDILYKNKDNKRILLSQFEKDGYEIKEKANLMIDYLKIIDTLYII
ncbi:MAG TPA: Holliday junction resolvase RecU [Bacilli bacterium]|nr:Holliday junction resolvase RecU [Bacilli bacterium]